MARRQIHFGLNPANPVEKEIIGILDNIPGRGVKAYICMLIRAEESGARNRLALPQVKEVDNLR